MPRSPSNAVPEAVEAETTDPSGSPTLEFWEIELELAGINYTARVIGRSMPELVGRGRSRYVALARLYKQIADYYVELADRERQVANKDGRCGPPPTDPIFVKQKF